jgi:HAD superfamily hydrolase (TIGR01509 family)
MTTLAMTFDFHNTLAECPEWFELEVRRLPSSFLTWWSASGDQAIEPGTREKADEHYRALRHEIMDHGNELSAEACLNAVFQTLDLNVSKSDIVEGVSELMRSALATTRPIPGAVETIRSLHDDGIRLGVVSSAVYHPFLVWSLEMFGIASAFTTVVTSASAGFYKSRPEIYEHSAAELAVAPDRIVHVGDSLRFDVGGASRAGMGTVWLQHRERREDEREFSPDLTLRTLTNSASPLLELLDRRNRQFSGRFA